MADAVKRIWPDAKLTIGPPIDIGFYYDFDVEHHFTDEDLVKLEKLMDEIVDADLPFKEQEITRDQAIDYFKKRERAVQGRAGAGHSRGRAHHAALARRVRRPLPRRPRQVDRRDQGVQAALGRRRLLARRREEQDAPAHLRHRVRRQEGARRVPASSAKRPRSATTASSARSSGCSRSIRWRPGSAFWHAARARSLYTTLQEFMRRAAARRRRLRRGQDAAAVSPGPVGAVGPLAALRATTCSRWSPRSRRSASSR